MGAPHQVSESHSVVLIAEHRQSPEQTGVTFVHDSGVVIRMTGADLEFLARRYSEEREHLNALGWLQ